MKPFFAFLQSKLNEKVKEPQSTPLKETKSYATYKNNISKMSQSEIEKLDKEIETYMNMDYGDELEIRLTNKALKYLEKLKNNKVAHTKIIRFLDEKLANAKNPASLPNAKKLI